MGSVCLLCGEPVMSMDSHSCPLAKKKPLDEDSVPGGFAVKVGEVVRSRGSAYGAPRDNHQLTADMWSAFLRGRLLLGDDFQLSAEDVCALNVLQKLSRLSFGTKDDSWMDVAGYAENVAMLRPEQRNH